MGQRDLYQQLVRVLEVYLGPSADRFMRRHIEAHLGKSAEAVSTKDIPELVTWVRLSLALISNDTALVTTCERKMLELAGTAPVLRRGNRQHNAA